MNKSIAAILLVSLVLVQCYSQYQYLPYEICEEELSKLNSVTFKDSAKYLIEGENYIFKLESDSLLIIQPLTQSHFVKIYPKQDTINLNDIKSVELTEINELKTLSVVVSGGLLILATIGVSKYLSGSSSPFTGKGLL